MSKKIREEYAKAELKRLQRIIDTCPEHHKAAVCTEECDAFHLCRKGEKVK